MSQNPFDDDAGSFLALVNDDGQYSLWPVFADIPSGWRAAYGAPEGRGRDEVLAWISRTWTDMRPASVRSAAVPADAR